MARTYTVCFTPSRCIALIAYAQSCYSERLNTWLQIKVAASAQAYREMQEDTQNCALEMCICLCDHKSTLRQLWTPTSFP